jgi:hypothetical protein
MRTTIFTLGMLVASLTLGARDAQAQFGGWNPIEDVARASKQVIDAVDIGIGNRIDPGPIPGRPPIVVGRLPIDCCGGMSCERARKIFEQAAMQMYILGRESVESRRAVEPAAVEAALTGILQSAAVRPRSMAERRADPTAEAASRGDLD